MAEPTDYSPSYSFTGWQEANPTKPLPGQQVDNELSNISTSLDETISALADVRRSDGKLKNQIVTFDSLDNDVRAAYTGGAISAWAPIVPFAAGIEARAEAPATAVTYQGETYVAASDHTTTAIFQPANWIKIAARGLAGPGSGDMLAENNLSDVDDVQQARANLSLDNVDNTSDAAKPISTATQTALTDLSSQIAALGTAVGTKVPATRQVATSGLISGGGTLEADRTLTVPIATQGEAEAGATNGKAMTPLRTAQAVAKHQAAAKAWVNFDGTGTVAIRASHNVSSITDFGTGHYGINFATPMASANYAMAGSVNASETGGNVLGIHHTVAPTTTACRVLVRTDGGSPFDGSIVSAVFFGA